MDVVHKPADGNVSHWLLKINRKLGLIESSNGKDVP